jgi:hypothetical protein
MSNAPFNPTHRTPPGGIATYPEPDAGVAPGPNATSGLDVQVLEQWGDWAKILCSNGWSAWVDGRRLLPRSGNAPRAQTHGSSSATGIDRATVVAFAGAALVLIGSFLPWTRSVQGSETTNAFDIKATFLVDYETVGDNGPKIGWLSLVIVAAVAVVVLRKLDDRARLACGIAAVAVAALYILQLQRLLGSYPADADVPGLIDYVGIGALLAGAGGLVIVFAPKIADRIPR